MGDPKISKFILLGMVLLVSVTPTTAGPASAAINKPQTSQTESHLLGVWKGDSLCQVKNSPCHDEKAIYQISKSKQAGKVTVDLGKIVDGKPESMAVYDFTYDSVRHKLICEQKYGVWELAINGDKMEGTLTTPDKVIYRKMTLKKE